MQNHTFTNHNRPDLLLLTGLLFLVPPSIAWLAVFSIVANIGILANISGTLLDALPNSGEIALLAGCPLVTAILGFVTFRQVQGRGEKIETLSLVTIGAGVLYILMAVLASLRTS